MLRRHAGHRVDGSRDVHTRRELVVQPHEHEPENRRRGNGHDAGHAVVHEGADVPGGHAVLVEVRGVDGRAVADGVDEGEGRGALCGGAGEGVGDPRESRRVATVDAGELPGAAISSWSMGLRTSGVTYHEHHADIPRGHCRRAGREDEGRRGKDERQDNVVVPLPRAVRVPRVDAGHDTAEDIRRRSEEESLDISETKSLDDRWEEVGDGPGRHDTEHQHELGGC